MNVVIWARVSSREQKEGYSLDAQVRACRALARKNAWRVVRVFSVAESAKRGARREAFNGMFTWIEANAKKKGIHAILSHKLDRVCRNIRDAVRLQELEDGCGVRLAFVENQFGPGAAGMLSFNVMAAVAQYYSDNLRSEVVKGLNERVRQGWPPGHAPFGYQNVDDRNEPVVPHPENSKTLVRIFELFSTGRYTLKTLADRLEAEGRFYRPSQRRFHRTALSYILNNRFYIGELHRNGAVYKGAYRLLIHRDTFDACQHILKGRNRRTGTPRHKFAGGLFRCALCGYAMTGELIRRKLGRGGVREHIYYRCGNNCPPSGHPTVRWRESALEEAIVEELDSIRLPSPEARRWFREALEEALCDADRSRSLQRRLLNKRRSELSGMKERLLDAFLAGTIDEAAFKAKSGEIRREVAQVARRLAAVESMDESVRETALCVFDFSQGLGELWRGSNYERKREILECVSLNRLVGPSSLCLTKRKPFDILAEGLGFVDGRGVCPKFEPEQNPITAFLEECLRLPEGFLPRLQRMSRIAV